MKREYEWQTSEVKEAMERKRRACKEMLHRTVVGVIRKEGMSIKYGKEKVKEMVKVKLEWRKSDNKLSKMFSE